MQDTRAKGLALWAFNGEALRPASGEEHELAATRYELQSRSAEGQGWVQESAAAELVEHIELLEAQIARLKVERADLSRASSPRRAGIVATSYALPGMAEEYLAGLPPVERSGRLRRALAQRARGRRSAR